MTSKEETLKRKRSGVRTQTTKLCNKIEATLGNDTLSLEVKFDQLNIFKDQLDEKYDSLKKLNSEIEELIAETEFDKEIESSETYSENIIESRYKIKKYLNEYNKKNQDALQNAFIRNENSGSQNVNFERSVNLPKLSINRFYGDPSLWLEFWSQYENAIEKNASLTPIDKFAYLKSLLGGSAHNVVSGFSLSEGNYNSAIELLKNRYGRQDLLINAHMTKLLNLKPVKSAAHAKELRQLYDNCEIQIRNLNSLGVTSGSYGHLLCPILIKLIPSEIALDFNRKRNSSESIDIEELLSFIKKETEAREAIQNIQSSEQQYQSNIKRENVKLPHKNYSNNYKRDIPSASALVTNIKNMCIFCDQTDHDSKSCKFLSIPEKREKLKREGRCYFCFRKFHVSAKCRYNLNPCKICNGKFHDTSICLNAVKNEPVPRKETSSDAILTSVSHCKINKDENSNYKPKEVILQTAIVVVESGKNSEICHSLMDVGSQRSFISKNLASKLNAPLIGKEKLQIFSFAAVTPQIKTCDIVQLKLSHVKDKSRCIFIDALVTDVISNSIITAPQLNQKIKNKLAAYELCNFNELPENKIELLVGADYFYQITSSINKVTNSLFVVNSLFGDLLCGSFQENETQLVNCVSVLNLSVSTPLDDLKFLWEFECVGINQNDEFSTTDKEILNTFENQLMFINNRYQAGLLWKEQGDIKLESNFRIAKKRLNDLCRKLNNDHVLRDKYSDIISEQERDGIIEKCSDTIEKSYFMPHSPVIRKDKTTSKVRVVYDASSRDKHSNSLNDCLHSGPNLNPNILDVIINFRKYNIAFCGDLEKAFLQIGIKREDRDYLKFLWFGENENEFKYLRFARVPFGITCSSFILAATIKYHIRKYTDHPKVINMLDSSLYVDDLISGANSNEEAYYLSTTASNIFKEAGMNLRKLNTNSVELRKMWEENNLHNSEENLSNSLKVLGLLWDTNSDNLYFEAQSFPDEWKSNPTKRVIVKAMLKIFDPIGLITPFTIRMKNLLQDTWERGLQWDDVLPSDLKKEWENWYSEIEHLNKFEIPRKYFSIGVEDCKAIEIHIFSDASPKAYGAIAYFRKISKNKIETSLIWSKSRVSPIKRLTIPRLELMGALIAARMCKYLKNLFKFQNLDVYLWSDSTITLHWIKGSALKWKPFVSNRVTEIQNMTDPKMWNYTSGKENPSDLLTRGEKLNNLIENKLWLYGPEWLSLSEDMWPKHKDIIFNTDLSEEMKSSFKATQLSCSVNTITEPLLKLENYRNLHKVYVITAYVLRFLNNTNKKKAKISGPLSATDIEKAEIYWIKQTQQSVFTHEINLLKHEKPINKESALFNLNPQLDENDLLVVSGRLEFSNLNYREKHPWIIPNGEKFTKLLIENAHEKVFHFGITTTLARLREKYFIIRARKCVKSVLKKCLICRRFNASPGKQNLAPLPRDRIVESPPFLTTATDFAGPVYVKTKTGSEKAYIVLFTCAVTRAIHLEVATSLSTETFILALKRFISRRGLCKTIYSDNAKTFLKTNDVLKEAWSRISKSEVERHFRKSNIIWKFIVPRASWWGGFWERMVRSVKTPLKKVLGKACLTYEEMQTTLAEIEAVINNRPLTYVYENSDEPLPLTPSQILIGKRTNFLPGVQYSTNLKSNKKTLSKLLKYREQLTEHFWKRWRKEYLLELRSANFTTPIKDVSDFKVGEIVLIHEDKVPKHMWRCGIIKENFPGRDGKVRSCALQTSSGIIKRPIQLLYKLELDIMD